MSSSIPFQPNSVDQNLKSVSKQKVSGFILSLIHQQTQHTVPTIRVITSKNLLCKSPPCFKRELLDTKKNKIPSPRSPLYLNILIAYGVAILSSFLAKAHGDMNRTTETKRLEALGVGSFQVSKKLRSNVNGDGDIAPVYI